MGWCRELVEPGGFDMRPFRIHMQLDPTHVPSTNVLLSTIQINLMQSLNSSIYT